MAFTKVSEEQVKLLLADGDRDARLQGVRLIQQQYRNPVAVVLRRKITDLPPEKLADAWQETVKQVIQRVVAGSLNPQGSLLAYLCTIALRRVHDANRWEALQKKALEKVLGPIAEALQGTQVGRKWGGLDPVERKEAMELIHKVIEELPERQQLVMRVYVDHFPLPPRNMEEFLRGEVERKTGTPQSLDAVTRALQEARGKVRKLLREKGYDFGEPRKRGGA